MKKKLMIILPTIILIFAVVVVILVKSNAFKTDNLWTEKTTDTTGEPSSEDSSSELSTDGLQASVSDEGTQDAASPAESSSTTEVTGELVKDKIAEFFDGLSILSMGDTGKADGYIIKVNSVEYTKERGDFEPPDWERFKYDKNGNLTNAYTYVIVDITIEYEEQVGESSNGNIFGLNSIWMQIFDKDGNYITKWEALSSDNDGEEGRLFMCELNVGESITKKIVYLLEDENLVDTNLVLYAEMMGKGSRGYDPNYQCCILLDQPK